MQRSTTSDRADGIEPLVPKALIRIPMTAFRVKRRFVERLVTEMLKDAKGAKDGPGHHLDVLLRSWAKDDCNLEKWVYANPDKFPALRETCRDWRVKPFEWIVPEPGHFKPTLMGAFGLDARAETRDRAEEWVAYDTFTAFVLLTSGTPVRIGICDRCGDLYWTYRRPLNKRFCSRKCSQLQTATEGQAKRLARERRKKNKRIRKALSEFAEQKPAVADWKGWIASRASVTRSYLTRTLNRGRCGEPDGLKLRKAQIQYLESKGRSPHANL